MACLLEETILRFVSGQLTSEELGEVEAHARGCAGCEALIAAALAAGASASAPAVPEPTANRDAPAGTLGAGSVVGRYTVLAFVGQGAMGEVYAAYDPKLDRRVALKLLRPRGSHSDERAEARLLREAQAIARLSHPNVISVHDVGAVGERVFVAMEYIEGQTLSAWLAAAPRSRPQILAVFIEAARGLAAAHAAGLVHRDFKPQNVMVGGDGSARVTDFGLARLVDSAEPDDLVTRGAVSEKLPIDARLTQTGELVGTPLYMAPEQFLRRRVDARTDQFSFCVALYQALYGEHPFLRSGIGQLMAAVTTGQVRPAPPRAVVPVWLRRVMLRGLAVDPAARFGTMDALSTALARDPNRRVRRGAAAVAGLLVAIAAVATVRLARRPEVMCGGGAARLAGAWVPGGHQATEQQRRTALRTAFLATGLSYAEETWMRVEGLLDRYAGHWIRGYEDACEASHVRGEQSAAVLDLRMACLDERLAALRSLTDLLAAADRQTVAAGVDAVNALPSLDRCADLGLLLAQVEPPRDEATRLRVEDLRRRAARAKALHDTGHQDKAIEQGRALVAEARSIGYLPVLAELLAMQGAFQTNAAFETDTVKGLEEAVWTALRCKRDDVAAEAAAMLIGMAGYNLHHPAEGTRWADMADALLDRMGPGHDLTRAWVLQGRAAVAANVDPPTQLRLTREALALKRKVLPPDHPDIGTSLLSEAEALAAMGDYAGALVANQEALDGMKRAYGAGGPFVAHAYSNRGEYLIALGRPEEALPLFRQALAGWEGALGPEHPYVGYPLTGIGRALLALGRPREALAPLERALVIREASEPRPAERAETRFALAQALWANGERARALDLAGRARREFSAGGEEREQQTIGQWLGQRATAGDRRRASDFDAPARVVGSSPMSPSPASQARPSRRNQPLVPPSVAPPLKK